MAQGPGIGLPPMMSFEESQHLIEEKTKDLPFTWEEVKGTEDYQSLDKATQERGKRQYYEDYVAGRGLSWEKFDEQDKPGTLGQIGASLQDMGAGITESAAVTAKMMGFEDTAQSMQKYAQGVREKTAAPVQLEHASAGWEQFKNVLTTDFWTLHLPRIIPQSVPIIAAGYAAGKVGAIGGGALGTAVAPGPGTAIGVVAGGVFGAMVGVAGASFAQSLGPAYNFFLSKNPGDEDGAVDYALDEAGLTAGFESLAVPLGLIGWGLKPFKHAFVQIGVQAVHGAGSAVVQNKIQQRVDPNIPWSQNIVEEMLLEGLFEAPALTLAARRGYKAIKDKAAGTPEGPPGAPSFFDEKELGFPNEANPDPNALPAPPARLGLPLPVNPTINQPATQSGLYQQLEAPAGTPPYGATPTPAPFPGREPTELEAGPAHPPIPQQGPVEPAPPPPGPSPLPGSPESLMTPERAAEILATHRQRAADRRAEQPPVEIQAEPVEEAPVEVPPVEEQPPVASGIDIEAHEAATSPVNELAEPTQAQKEAGNYKKGHVNFQGLEVTIENPAGSTRSGVSKAGKAWETPIVHHYGYVKRTEGADGDQVDVFIGPQETSDRVFVVDQVDPETGKFDEHKVMLGFETENDAADGYLVNYEQGWKGLGAISEMDVSGFKGWLEDGDTTKPLALPPESAQAPAQAPKPEPKAPTTPEPVKEPKKADITFEHEPLEPGVREDTTISKVSSSGEDTGVELRLNDEDNDVVSVTVVDKHGQSPGNPSEVAKFQGHIDEEAEFIQQAEAAARNYLKRMEDQEALSLDEKPEPTKGPGSMVHVRPEDAPPYKPKPKDDIMAGVKRPPPVADPTQGPKEKPDETQQVGKDGESTLEAEPAEPVSRPGEERPAPQDTTGGRGDDLAPTGEAGEGAGGEGVSAAPSSDDGGGDGAAGAGAETERGTDARPGGGIEDAGATQPGNNYRITEADNLGEGGPVQKFEENIAALKLLKKLEEEGRMATREEQAILVKYVGWGGISESFVTYGAKGNWLQRAEQLKKLLTDEEYREAKRSTINAHYTAPNVVGFMYDALRKMGFDHGKVLDPSTGTGHFIGLMPPWHSNKSAFTAIERDGLTARLATQIYPDAEIRQMEFQDARLPDNFFDLAITNVPFADTKYSYKKKGKFTLHNYFFMKSLDKVRPGGVVAFITSTGTMDAKGNAWVRNLIAQQADMVAAFRLPLQAFKKNALTEVTTDVIFLRKRDPSSPASTKVPKWNVSKDWRGRFDVNEYYHDNPSHLFGALTDDKLHPGSRSGTSLREGETLDEHMAKALEAVPENVYERPASVQTKPQDKPKLEILAPEDVKELSYVVEGTKIMQREGGVLREVMDTKGVRGQRMAGMIGIRGALRSVLQSQVEEHGDAQIAGAQKVMNDRYDRFVKEWGPVSSQPNRLVFREDPEYPLLQALENYDRDKKTATKTDIFTKRTIERPKSILSVDTASEALSISLNEWGEINLTHMENITGKTRDEIIQDLKGVIFQESPENYVTADEYLSGNVRQKLLDAKEAAEIDKVFRENVEALEEVQPDDLPPSKISARLGAVWIPTTDIQDFAQEILGIRTKVKHSDLTSLWVVDRQSEHVKNSQEWATARWNGDQFLEKSLNLLQPTAYDKDSEGKSFVNTEETAKGREKQSLLKDRFKEWIWGNPDRAERLARYYNDNYNNLRDQTFDGAHLTLPGANPLIFKSLHKHQLDAIWRGIISKGNLLLAHAVGAGKTWEMAGIAMERRRLGLSKKPLFVIPNPLVESGQFAKEFIRMYPNAKILSATPDDFKKDKRKRMIARIATGDWDAVVIGHSSFKMIPVSHATERAYIEEQLATYEAAIQSFGRDQGRSEKRMVKELEKAKDRLNARIKEMLAKVQSDDVVTFEELGVDHLSVDEAHNFKNLAIATKLGRMPGVSAGDDPGKTQDMYMKVRYLQGINNGGGVVFATATPISNSMVEMFTLSRYLDPQGLKEQGLEAFDSWAGTYGEPVTAMELDPTGAGFRLHTRFARFVNLPELTSRMRTFADVQTSAMLNLPVPKIKTGKPVVVAIPPSDALKEYVRQLGARADALRGKPPGPGDNMLVVTGDGRHAALDMRTVLDGHPAEPESKLPVVADSITKIWEAGKEQKLTQLAFLDISAPDAATGARGFSGYRELKALLIERGVEKEEIAFVHDFEKAKREILYRKVRSGDIRVLIGSTGKMGEGTNVQAKLKALHHVDIPWTPAGIEQRNGRIVRQGNENEEVEIYNYVTEGSFDAYFWQTQETKAKFIAQILTGNIDVRFAEDVDGVALNAAEAKAIATGNPLVKEKAEIDAQVVKLAVQRRAHSDSDHSARSELKHLEGRLIQERKEAEAARKDMPLVEKFHAAEAKRKEGKPEPGQVFPITVMGTEYTERKEANKALIAAMKGTKGTTGMVQIGNFAGFKLRVRWTMESIVLSAEGEHTIYSNFDNISDAHLVVQNILDRINPNISQTDATVKNIEGQIAELEKLIGRPWPKEAEYDALVVRQEELYRELDLHKKGEESVAEEETEVDEDGPLMTEAEEIELTAHSPKIPNIGHENTVVTREDAQQLQDEIADDLEKKLHAGIDPDTMAKTGKLAAFYIEAGVRKFADFSQYMLDALGKGIKRYLGGAFLRGKRTLGREARKSGPRKPPPFRGDDPRVERAGAKLGVPVTLADKLLSIPWRLTGDAWPKGFEWGEAKVLARIPERVKAGTFPNYGQTPEAAMGEARYNASIRRWNRGILKIANFLDLGEVETAIVYEWLQEKPREGREQELLAQLDPDKVKGLQEIKSVIRIAGEELVRLKLLSPESFARNENAYVHRTYRIHELDENGQPTKRRKRAMRIHGEELKGRGRFDEYKVMRLFGDNSKEWANSREPLLGSKFIRYNAVDKLGRLRKRAYVHNNYPVPAKFTAPGSNWVLDEDADTGAANLWEARDMKGKNPIMWRDFTKSERTLNGEILDAKYAVVRTLMQMVRDMEAGRYFEWMADHRDSEGNPDWVLDSDEQIPEGDTLARGEGSQHRAYLPNEWVQVPSTRIKKSGGVPAYGAISGKYVRGPLWNDVRHVAEFDTSFLPDWWKRLLRAFKISKTALSPAVSVNNVMANVVLADWGDISRKNMIRSLSTYYKSWRGDERATSLLERADDAGSFFGGYASAELQKQVLEPIEAELNKQLKEDAEKADTGNLFKMADTLVLLEPLWSAAVWAKDKSVELYQFEDNVFRMAAFLDALDRGLPDVEAGSFARDAFLNYDIKAPWINFVRATGIPFVSFSYTAIPRLKNTAKQTPWKLLKLALFIGALDALGTAISGGDEEQERAYLSARKSRKIFGLFPQVIRMPWDSDGHPVFLDITRWIPVGDFMFFDESPSVLPLPPYMMLGGPVEWFIELYANKSIFTRREIHPEGATIPERAGAGAMHLYKGIMPNLIFIPRSYAWDKLGLPGSTRKQKDPFGREYPKLLGVLNAFGLKLAAYPLDNMQRSYLLGHERKLGLLKGRLNKIKSDIQGGVPAEDLGTLTKEYNYVQAEVEKLANEAAERSEQWERGAERKRRRDPLKRQSQ